MAYLVLAKETTLATDPTSDFYGLCYCISKKLLYFFILSCHIMVSGFLLQIHLIVDLL